IVATIHSGPTGALLGLLGRAGSGAYDLAWTSVGNSNLKITSSSGGLLATGAIGSPIQANTDYTLRLRLQGTSVQAKIWPSASSEPAGWQVSATDPVVGSGFAGVFVGFQVGPNSATFSFDNVLVMPL